MILALLLVTPFYAYLEMAGFKLFLTAFKKFTEIEREYSALEPI